MPGYRLGVLCMHGMRGELISLRLGRIRAEIIKLSLEMREPGWVLPYSEVGKK